MLGIDWTLVLIGLGVLVILFLAVDFLFAGGGMTGGMIGAAAQRGAAAMGSPYGWTLVVALVVIVLVAFGLIFGVR